jgi:hypothetical protein
MKFEIALVSAFCILTPIAAMAWTPVADGPRVSGIQQKMVVFHNDGKETLFWSPTVDVDKDGKATIVFALPTPPTKVSRLGKESIEDLAKVVQVSWLDSAKKRGDESSDDDTGEVIPSGTLEIHTLTTQGVEAESSLSDLLTELSLPGIDVKDLKYHVQNNWTFAAVSWDAKAGRQTLAPLRIDFESAAPVLPLMALKGQGGSVQAFFFSAGEMSDVAEMNLEKFGFTFAVDRRKIGPNPKKSMWIMGQSSFYLRNLPIAPKTLLAEHISAQRVFARVAVLGDLSKASKRWKGEPFAGDPDVSLESSTVEAIVPSDQEVPETDMGFVPSESESTEVPPEVAEMLSDAADVDWTLVCGAIGLVFFLGAVTVVQVRRRF